MARSLVLLRTYTRISWCLWNKHLGSTRIVRDSTGSTLKFTVFERQSISSPNTQAEYLLGQLAVLTSNNLYSNEVFLNCKGYTHSQFILSEKVALLIFLVQSISMHYTNRRLCLFLLTKTTENIMQRLSFLLYFTVGYELWECWFTQAQNVLVATRHSQTP